MTAFGILMFLGIVVKEQIYEKCNNVRVAQSVLMVFHTPIVGLIISKKMSLYCTYLYYMNIFTFPCMSKWNTMNTYSAAVLIKETTS